MPITHTMFAKLKRHDFDNGAIIDDIWASLREGEKARQQIARLRRIIDDARRAAVEAGSWIADGRQDKAKDRIDLVLRLLEIEDGQ